MSRPLLFLLLAIIGIESRISGATATEKEQPEQQQADQPAEMDIEKRMFSYADLMNNFGGPTSLDLVPAGNGFYLIDEERPKREDEQQLELFSAWKRSPSFPGRGYLSQGNYLMKKDEFVAPGVLRFGKRMPGVLRFGKRMAQQTKKDVPGVLRFGKRADVPGVLRFGKRMPQVLRFGRR